MRRLVLVLVSAAALTVPAGAGAWAPVATAPIHPGVQTFTDGAQCTANFVFTAGTTVLLGQAAHCSGTGAATETDGCDSASLPEGTPVQIGSTGVTGTMAYNSWIRMQAAGETDPETCAYNDLALIEIPAAAVSKVNPSVPKLGGPTGLGGAPDGSTVFTYGNSELRLGIALLSPKQGTVLSHTPGGWSRDVLTVTPGVPGDSGSGFLNATGQAFGVLSTVQLAPLAGSNGVGDLASEIAYAQAHGVAGLALVPGTEPFRGSIL
jgi:hypothetical protein